VFRYKMMILYSRLGLTCCPFVPLYHVFTSKTVITIFVCVVQIVRVGAYVDMHSIRFSFELVQLKIGRTKWVKLVLADWGSVE